MASIDWKAAREDAKAASVLIPDGEFPFECVSADAQLSNGGAPQIVADFLCLNDRYNKRTVRHWFTLSLDSPVALDIFFKTMKVFGMGDEYFEKGAPEMEDIAGRLLNQKVTCGVKTSEWNGQDRNKLSYFKKLTAGGARAAGGGAKKGPAAPAPRPAAKKTATGAIAGAMAKKAPAPTPEDHGEEPAF